MMTNNRNRMIEVLDAKRILFIKFLIACFRLVVCEYWYYIKILACCYNSNGFEPIVSITKEYGHRKLYNE